MNSINPIIIAAAISLFLSGCFSQEFISINDLPSEKIDDEIEINMPDSSSYYLKKKITLQDLLDSPDKKYYRIDHSSPEELSLVRIKAAVKPGEQLTRDTILIKRSEVVSVKVDDPGWSNSLYTSAGYGSPVGLRIEIGYNLWRSLSVAVVLGRWDNWINIPGEGTLGGLVKVNISVNYHYVPYILFAYGGTMATNRPDDYILINAGTRIRLSNWLMFSPELGWAFTSRYISGGKIAWVNKSLPYKPEVTDKLSRLGWNVSFEICF
jgi:hypothetical protein